MDAKAATQCLLGETANVTGIGRSLKPVEEDYLPYRSLDRLMLENQDCVAVINFVLFVGNRESVLINAARPEISRDGEEVRIAEEWMEAGPQISV